jgi:hypothetical protein
MLVGEIGFDPGGRIFGTRRSTGYRLRQGRRTSWCAGPGSHRRALIRFFSACIAAITGSLLHRSRAALTIEQPTSDSTVRNMSDEHHQLALRQADQPRTDISNLESELEMIMARLARMPTRVDLARAALMSTLGGAALVDGLALFFRS